MNNNKIIIPPNALMVLWKEFITERYICRIASNQRITINAVLIPLMCIPGMKFLIHDYLISGPDEGVTTYNIKVTIPAGASEEEKARLKLQNEGKISLSDAWVSVGFDQLTTEYKRSRADAEFIASMVILGMFKNMGEEHQLTKVLQARMKGFYACVSRQRPPQGSVESWFNTDYFEKVFEIMGLLPKLKSFVASYAIASRTPFSRYVREILSGAQLTVFNMIYEFVFNVEKRAIHVNREVMTETIEFIKKFTRIKKRFGAGWKYAKVLDPQDQLTSLEEFKFLPQAAFAYMVVTSANPDNMAYSELAKGFNKRTAKLCMERIPVDMLSGERMDYLSEIKSFYADNNIEFPFKDTIKDFEMRGEFSEADLKFVDDFIKRVKTRGRIVN